MSGWHTATLGDLIELQRGHDLPEQDRRPGTVPVVGSAGVNGFHDRARSIGPGVTVGRSGASIGVVTYVDQDYWPHNTVLFVRDFKGNDPRFIAGLLQGLNLARLNSGSAQPSLNRNFVYPQIVRVPSFRTQVRIGSILGVYEDILRVNGRRITILEEMVRRLFEEWFVRFRYPGNEILAAPQSEHPPGWQAFRLADWAIEVRDAVLPSQLDPATRYIGLEHLPRRSTTMSEFGRADAVTSTKLRFQPGDVLFGKIRPYFHKVAYATCAGVTSSDTIVIRAKDPTAVPLILALASSDQFVAHAVATSNGTKMPRADWKVLRNYPLPRPRADLLEKFNNIVGPNVRLCANLAEQNNRLRAARDLLVPKLISGEIDLSAAEAEVEAAA